MNKLHFCVVAVMGASLIGGVSAARAEAADRTLALSSKFEIDSGETVAVKRGSATKGYRVCMDAVPHALPLRVRYDGKEQIVEPGECRLIEARVIKLSSAGRLRDGLTLIGSFNGISTQHADADMRVAQVAGDN